MMVSGEVIEPLLVLRPSRSKWVKILIGSILFVVAGIFLLHIDRGDGRTMAWICIVFFGSGVVVSLFQLLTDKNYLMITKTGLVIGTMVRTDFIPWDDIDLFGVLEWRQWHGPFRQTHHYVGMNFRVESASYLRKRRVVDVASGLVGYHGMLPDSYGYKVDALAELLNDNLHRYRED